MGSNETLDQIEEDLVEEERILSETLKGMCDEKGREKNKDETTPILHQLGLLYMKRKHDKWCLVQSAALLQAAIIRKNSGENETVEKDLQSLWMLVLEEAQASKSKTDLSDISHEVSAEVKHMRDYVKVQLEKFLEIVQESTEEEVYRMEKEKIDDIKTLQEEITKQYVSIMHRLSDYCVSVLGDPPSSCKFALVGMGSVARKEVTPYSDFENCIVLEEGIQNEANYNSILEYFRWFAVAFHIVLISLGETFLPSVAITSLNDYYGTQGKWFYDRFTPSGISFDGHRPHACKSPHGRQKPTEKKSFTIELIQPISKMINYLNSDEDLKNGYHLAAILARTCYISGDNTVYNDFESRVMEKLKDQRNNSSLFRKLLRKEVKENKQDFNIEKNLRQLFHEEKINIKRVVYRSITIFVAAYGKFIGIGKSSCLEIVHEMKERRLVSEDVAHKLSYAISVACEVRLKVYAQKNEQNDLLTHRNVFESAALGLVDAVGEKSAVDYFSIAFSLQQALPSFTRSNLKCGLDDDLNKNKECSVFIYFFLGMCKKCIKLSSDQVKNKVFPCDPESRSIYLTFVGLSYFFTKEIQEAMREFDLYLRRLTSSENKDKPLENYANSIDNCLHLIKDRFKKNKTIIDEFINTFKKMHPQKTYSSSDNKNESVGNDNDASDTDQLSCFTACFPSFSNASLELLEEIDIGSPLHLFNVAKFKYTIQILKKQLSRTIDTLNNSPLQSSSSCSSSSSSSLTSSSSCSSSSSGSDSSSDESSTSSSCNEAEEDEREPSIAAHLKCVGQGFAMIKLHRYKDALCEFQLAILLWSFCCIRDAAEVRNFIAAGIALFKQSQYEKALLLFEKIILLDIEEPMKSSCKFYIGRCFFKLKRYENARESLKQEHQDLELTCLSLVKRMVIEDQRILFHMFSNSQPQ